MCQEDLRLGYAKQFGQSAIVGDSAATDPILPANPNRTALLFCAITSAALPGFVGLSSKAAQNGTFANIWFNGTGGIGNSLVLRVEDYGQIIQGPIFQSGSSAGNDGLVTEIVLRAGVTPFKPSEAK